MSGQCYDWHAETNSAQKLPNYWAPCPETLGCCVVGDACLDHNICHTSNAASPDSGGSYSQYYIQRCSDPTYTNPDCQKVCDPPGPPDVVYNFNSQQWACCGEDSTGNVSCNAPTNEIFQAPAPDQLATISTGAVVASTATIIPGSKTSIATTSSGGSSSSSTTAISSGTSAGFTSVSSMPTSTDAAAQSQSSGLSTGAEAGIGVGVAIAVIAIIAIVVFFLLKRRKARSNVDAVDLKYEREGPVYVEKAADATRPELATGWNSLELQNTDANQKARWPEPIHELDNER